MKPTKNTIHLLIALLLSSQLIGYGQNSAPVDSLDSKLKLAARDIMTTANTCALITLDHEGHPRARMMDPFAPEEDFTVWFGTNSKSRKVAQIRHDPRVTLYYEAAGDAGYVVVHGTAELVDDPQEKANRWKEAWEQFYPDRMGTYLLIRVVPQRMEVVSYTHGLVGNPETWEPPAVDFESE